MTAANPIDRFIAQAAKVDQPLRGRLLHGPLADLPQGSVERIVAAQLNGCSQDPLTSTLFLDGQLGLVDDMLHYFDRASMARSLEVRVPFLDHHVVEFCATSPTDLKVRGLTTKYLLKRAARGIVPDRIIDKRKVGFFNAAVGAWFRSQADGAISDYLLARARIRGDARAGRRSRNSSPSTCAPDRETRNLACSPILMLEVWLSDFLPRALAPPSRAAGVVVAR